MQDDNDKLVEQHKRKQAVLATSMTELAKWDVYSEMVRASERAIAGLLPAIPITPSSLPEFVPLLPARPKQEPRPEPEPAAPSFQQELARVFGIEPNAPDSVLLDTAKRVWAGYEAERADWDRQLKSAHAAIDAWSSSRAKLADTCGELRRENKQLRERLGAALLRLEMETKR